jgi:hypothetical protein
LFPATARADGIEFGFVAIAGIAILVPLTAFVVLVEGIFIAIGLRIPYRRCLAPVLAANLASLGAGIPVKIFNAWMYSRILPHPLAPYFRWYPLAILLGTTIYFLVTLIVEYFLIAGWCRKNVVPVSLGRIALFVFIANAASYAVLAPLHYIATRPIHDIREFTDDSRWAHSPPVRFYYVSNNGQLCSVMTNGRDTQVVVPDVVRDYQYLPDQNAFLYRNGVNNLCLFRESDKKPLLCWSTNQRFMMEQVAFSPNGKTVAYLSRTDPRKPYELLLYDVESGQRTSTGIITDKDAHDPEIAWSDRPFTLFLKNGRNVETITLDRNMSATRAKATSSNSTLSRVYGRFSNGHWWGGGDWGAFLSHDQAPGLEADTMPGLGSNLRVKVGETSFVLADNPGLLKLPHRGFNDVCFLENGKELIFDDYHDIYLLDVSKRKVGRISDGSKFILLTPKYLRELWKAND